MKLSTLIGRALAPACLCAFGAATAQGTAPQTVNITATRVPTRVADTVADVTVLDRAAIERFEGRTLVELLSQQAGLQFSSNGGLGKTASLFIRGLEGRHTLLLVDGVRIASATVGSPSFDNLPLEVIDRIEIVRGPMGALYGTGAVGGVVQIFTRRAAAGLAGNAKLSAGSNDFRQAAGGVGFGSGSFDIAAQLQHTVTDGFSAANERVPFGSFNDDRDGFRQTAGSLRLGWQPLADWRFEALALQSRGTTQLDDGPGADARARLGTGLLALSATGQVLPGWRTRFSASGASDRYDTLASASAFATLGEIETAQRQYAWENTVATPLGSVLLLLERLEEKVARPGRPFAVSERHIDGVALALSGAADAHSWQASLRRDRNSQFGQQTVGAAAYGFAVTPAWRVGASVGTSYVAPSFNQLYFPNFGNPNLQPEEGTRHAELSTRWSAGGHSLRAAVFKNRYRGYITSGPAPVNLPLAEVQGVTVSWDGRWRALDLAASYDHTDPRNTTAGSANAGKQLPRRARNTARLSADWDGGAWSVGASALATSSRFDDSGNSARLAGYGRVDLRAEWTLLPQWRLSVRLNNVSDKAYETTLGYNQPGREGFVTLRYAGR